MIEDEPTDARVDGWERGPSGRLLRTVGALVGVGALTLVHLEVLERGPGYAGPLLVLDHVFDAGLAALLVVLSLAAGRAFLDRTGLEPEGRVATLLHSVAVGAGLWSTLFLALGAVAALAPIWIWLALGGGSLLLRRELGRLRRLTGEGLSELRRRVPGRWLPGLAVAATAAAGAFLFLHGSAPPGDWDSLMYHLEIPAQWLSEGRISLPEGNLHAAFTGLVQLLYLPFLAAGSPAAAALLNGIFALLLALAVAEVGRRLLDAETGVLAATLLWASTGILIVASTARVDVTLAFYLLLGHGALVSAAVDSGRGGRAFLLASLVLGLSVGAKYHALAYGACLAPVGLWAVWRTGETTRGRVRLLALGAAAALAAAAPWMLKNQALFGAPFYPFFTERILPPWLAALYGSSAIPDAVGAGAFQPLAQAREPFDLVALFLEPGRLTVEPEGAHYNLNPLLVLAPVALLFAGRPELLALAGPPLLYVVGIALFRPETNLRYLFPALAPLTVASTGVAVLLLRKMVGERLRRGILGVAAAVALVPSVLSSLAWTRRAPVVAQAAGTVSRQDYLASSFPFYASLAGTVNRGVPADGKVLLLWEARGFYLSPPHLQDNVLTNWTLLVPYLDRTGSCLADSEITHVLASRAAVRYYRSRGTDPALFRWERFQAFAERCLEVEERGGGFTLYRIAPG